MTRQGVFKIGSMIGSQSTQAGLPDGRWVRAVPAPFYWGVHVRLKAAWAVLTGAAVAVEWPDAGELEQALNR